MKIENTKFYSKKINTLPKGCQLCIQGKKLVLFITGICPRHCYFCPINEKKYQHDVIFANEMPTKKIKDVINEAKLCDSKGAGITGGDPLCKLQRTTSYIKQLKKQFGKKFHIHLYTSLNLINNKNLKKLNSAGLDEIRFHIDIDNDKLWNKIELVNQFKWDIGVEIPSIPGKLRQLKKLIDYFQNKIQFLNLNELEIADNTMSKLSKLGFKTKNKTTYAVKDSEETATKLMKYILKKKYNLKVHYCSAKLKDKVQLGNRIKRRAKNVEKEYDIIDEEGMLIRGAIYCKNLSKVRNELIKEYKIPKELIEIDKKKNRILTGGWIVDELKEELKAKGLKIAIVQEYPTWDRLEIRVDFL